MSEGAPIEGRAAAKPVRTWRPMILWSASLVAVLLLAWAGTVLCLSLRETHGIVSAVQVQPPPWGQSFGPAEAVRELGGPELAAGRLALYLRWPEKLAPYRGRRDAGRVCPVLAECGGPGVPVLAGMLRTGDERQRQLAAVHLNRLGPVAAPATQALAGALADKSASVRAIAAYALAAIGPPAASAVPELTGALSDAETNVRAAAARALKRVSGQEPPDPALDSGWIIAE